MACYASARIKIKAKRFITSKLTDFLCPKKYLFISTLHCSRHNKDDEKKERSSVLPLAIALALNNLFLSFFFFIIKL